jgi:hypothetical protein
MQRKAWELTYWNTIVMVVVVVVMMITSTTTPCTNPPLLNSPAPPTLPPTTTTTKQSRTTPITPTHAWEQSKTRPDVRLESKSFGQNWKTIRSKQEGFPRSTLWFQSFPFWGRINLVKITKDTNS